jgi:hypothetical protein
LTSFTCVHLSVSCAGVPRSYTDDRRALCGSDVLTARAAVLADTPTQSPFGELAVAGTWPRVDLSVSASRPFSSTVVSAGGFSA